MAKVSVEVATAEFNRFADCMDLDLDEKMMTDEDKVDFSALKSQFIRAVVSGHITLNDEGEPTIHFKLPPSDDEADQKITFFEPDGACFLALDKGKKNADMAKQYLMMGDICKCAHTLFAKLKNRDLKVCKMVLALFLA